MSRLAFATLALVVACSGETDGPPSNPGGAGGHGGMGTGPGGTTMTSAVGGMTSLPDVFTVQGSVVDQDGAPVADALVLQGGRSYEPPHLTTGSDGSFSIEIQSSGYGRPTVVAAKPGHRAVGFEFLEPPAMPLVLTMYRADPPDNPAYEYGDPGVGDDPSTKYCGHCHATLAKEFQTSKHAQATKNPLVQDLYAGVSRAYVDAASCAAAGGQWKQGLSPGSASDAIDKCYLGGGVLADLNVACGDPAEPACDDPAIPSQNAPSAFGACADCHAPGIDGVAGGRNLHEAVGIAFDNGVHCDVCHKVADVDLSLPPGIGQRLILQRPQEPSQSPTAEWRPVYFGPLLDVPNAIMGGSYQPKFDDAVFCAGCHQQHQPALVPGDSLDAQRWPDGLPVHTTYAEWLAGPFSSADTPCQSCHMPARFDAANSIDTATVDNASITFGWPRPPEDNRRHIFRSPLFHGSPRLIDGALYVSVNLALDGGDVEASVSLSNIGCGHAVPTGEPMRALVLLVSAQGGGCGQALPPTGGMTVHDVGGALARGVEAEDVSTGGAVMTWAAGALAASPGMRVRVVRPSGLFDDYTGVGFFADPLLTPAEKGLEIMTPVGEATVQSAGSGQLSLDQTIAVQAGDVVYLGDAATASDGQASLRLAGAAGYTFSKVLTDAGGSRGVPHHRAVDVASDNRIPPGDSALTTHRFAAVSGCTSATVDAVVLYRPIPTEMAALRGWDARDYVIATAQATIALP